MEQRGDRSWRIINAPKVADWILKLEQKLAEAINESMAVPDLLQETYQRPRPVSDNRPLTG